MKSIERMAGEPEPVTYDTTEELGIPSFVIAPGGPDWVITPPELGSKKLYFEDRFLRTWEYCPNCKAHDTEIKVSTFKDSGLACLETLNCCKQFCWVRP